MEQISRRTAVFADRSLLAGNLFVRFTSSSSGNEALVLSAAMAANLDRPVTVAGTRVKLNTNQAQVTFTEGVGFSDVFIDASFDRAPSPNSIWLSRFTTPFFECRSGDPPADGTEF